MIDENKFNQYGFPRSESEILGITIHETNNIEKTAKDLEEYLNHECKTSQGCHYIVDNTEVVQIMPDDWAVYHTGKGKDFGCRYTLAVEICSSLSDEKYYSAEDKAVELIKQLQERYHIKNDMIFFHQDFNDRTHCPNRILNKYGTSKNFVYQRIQEE